MAGFSDYAEEAILDHITGKATFAAVSVWVALSTTAPQEDGTGVAEPVGNSYARKATIAANWEDAVAGHIQNAQDITFAEASGAWGLITHFALYDAVTEGNMLAYSILGASKTIGDGDTPKFAIGDLDITLD